MLTVGSRFINGTLTINNNKAERVEYFCITRARALIPHTSRGIRKVTPRS
jgi:hypothetical protein